jgi:Zn-dependent M28 family amino/carboxypeptidase
VVVLLSGSPRTFPHNQRAYYSQGVQKEANAVAREARGIITVRTPVDEVRTTWERQIRQGRLPGMRWTDSGGVPHDSHPELEMGAALNRSGAEALFEGAPHSLQDVFANAETGRARSFDLPTRVRARRATDHSRAVSPNVVAVLRGSDPRLRDEYVVYTCHLDHLGISTPVNGDSINNGAYDNASGTAIVIELARALKSLPTRPRRSILFVAVTGEEKGLQGSDYFAHFPTVPPAGIVADINLHMFLMLQPLDNITVFGAEHSSLGPVIDRAAKRLGVGVLPDASPEEVIFVRSDQFSFVKQGVPALFPVAGGRTGGPGHEAVEAWLRSTYHSPQDDFSQKMDLTAGVRFAKINLLTGWWVANETARPRWNPGDFFGEKFGSGRAGSITKPSP